MMILRRLICCFLLFALTVIGTSGAWSLPAMETQKLTHPTFASHQTIKAPDRAFTARGPPLTAGHIITTVGPVTTTAATHALPAPTFQQASLHFNPVSVATNRTPQITINRQNGAEFERQVVDAFGHVGGAKNTTPVTVTLQNGTEVTTIPDLWGTNVGGLLEAKNVQNLSMSDQLRAQIQVATDTGQPLNLVVSTRTQSVSGPLVNGVQSTGGNVYVYNPATDSLAPW